MLPPAALAAAGIRLDGAARNDDFADTDKVMRFEVTDGAFDGANNAIPDRLDVGPEAIEMMALTRDQARQTTRLDVERSRAGLGDQRPDVDGRRG